MTTRGRAAHIAACALLLAGCATVGKPPWWPKPKPVYALSCPDTAGGGPEMRHLQLVAEVDMDDDHVKQTSLIDPRNPKATPWNAQLARIGECYSRAKDIAPEAKGSVVVRYTAGEGTGAPSVCLVRTDIADGALVDCAMQGVRSLPRAWLDYGGMSDVVSVDFIPETEAGYRDWYGTGEMRWWGDQAPRLRDVPASD